MPRQRTTTTLWCTLCLDVKGVAHIGRRRPSPAVARTRAIAASVALSKWKQYVAQSPWRAQPERSGLSSAEDEDVDVAVDRDATLTHADARRLCTAYPSDITLAVRCEHALP